MASISLRHLVSTLLLLIASFAFFGQVAQAQRGPTITNKVGGLLPAHCAC